MHKEWSLALWKAFQELVGRWIPEGISPGPTERGRCRLPVEVSAIVGFSGPVRGGLRLAGPFSSVRLLAATMVGEHHLEDRSELLDAFSEIANVLTGSVTTRLEGPMGVMRLAPPVLVTGPLHHVGCEQSFCCMNQQFDILGHPFFVEIFTSRDLDVDETESRSALEIGVDTLDPLRDALLPRIRESAGDAARILIRELLPEITREVVREELRRLASETERSSEEAEVTETLRAILAERIETVAREEIRRETRLMLPAIAGQLVREAIGRLTDPDENYR
ncbi:MAG: chemotaxis protein CheX [Magnetococcales bacterium]|nr:chemotaxis protein CheX [Magnetococcales bacterium]